MKKVIDYILLYVIGNILFNLIFSLAEFVVSCILSLNLNFFIILIKNITNNFILYTVLFFIIVLGLYFVDLHLINELNKKLKMGKTNEK